jgi:uncharacterized membrane protein
MAIKFYESTPRSLIKTITFRVLIIIADVVIVYALTHRFDLVITIVILRNAVAMFLYYFHERFWNAVNWGRMKKK